MLSHDFYTWIYGCVPVSSDDDPCSVPLDFPFFRFGEPLVGISLLLISEDIISFNSFICRPTLSLRSDKSFRNFSRSLSISASLRFMLARPDMAPSLGGAG
jgi:hypothetical protein